MEKDFSWVRKVADTTKTRLDWVPGEDWAKARTIIREACPADLKRLSKLIHASQKKLYTMIMSHGWTLYVAAQTQRNIVGALLAKHEEAENVLLRWYSNPRYETPDFMQRMCVLMALEQPSVPTRIVLPKDDVAMLSVVRALGWKCSGITDETNSYSCPPKEPVAAECLEDKK